MDVAEAAARALGLLGLQGAQHAVEIVACLGDPDVAAAALESLLLLLEQPCFEAKERTAAAVAKHFAEGGQAAKKGSQQPLKESSRHIVLSYFKDVLRGFKRFLRCFKAF